MDKEIFRLTEATIERRLRIEREHLNKILGTFDLTLYQIKNTDEADGWERIIFSDIAFFKNINPENKILLIYVLRKHPNVISKLSHKETKKLPPQLSPRVFKFVDADYKISLGFQANYFRGIPPEILDAVKEKTPIYNDATTDILTVLEYLCSLKPTTWTEITATSIAAKSGEFLENVCFSLSALLKMKIIVLAHIEGERRKSCVKLMFRFTLTDAEYKSALKGKGIDAIEIFSAEDASTEDFDFSVEEYFRELIKYSVEETDSDIEQEVLFDGDETQADDEFQVEEELPPLDDEIQADDELPPLDDEIHVEEESTPTNTVPAETTPKIIAVSNPQIEQTLENIQQCMTAFVEVAKTLHSGEQRRDELFNNFLNRNEQSEQRRNELLNNLLNRNEQNEQRRNEILNHLVNRGEQKDQESESLRNQIAELRRIINKKDRDRLQMVKEVQDSLNLFIGQVVNTTAKFANTPRYNFNEKTIAEFTTNITNIVVQTEKSIQKILSEDQD